MHILQLSGGLFGSADCRCRTAIGSNTKFGRDTKDLFDPH